MDIRLKRAYDTAARSDGPRILIDRITLVFAAKDTDHNNAVALRGFVLNNRL